eukprot:TRINITY_DN1779_c0_g1_i2.p1 TRINITY_DN1779_c0_g1~~TRINITY_DN1779_c0_g1_i2.p1  ORF type:complete len:577 (+),score=236.04 TRINITY_DN1779_c0_g1_i2:63-1793(+)
MGGYRARTPRRSTAARATTPSAKAGQRDKLVLNKHDLNSIKHIAYEYPEVEFLYLRENDFDSFDPYIRLLDLRMLDLSLNNINSVAFLWGGSLPADGRAGELSLPRLRHLYLTGNCIESLDGLSHLHTLETLALSNNRISSFEGLGALPNLKVLSLQYNNICSFKHFPFLLSLSVLGMQGNPISEASTYRAMAASVCCAYLQKIDGQAVTDTEMDMADRMQGKVRFCVTEGFVPSTLDDDMLKAEADTFLLDLQRQQSLGKPLRLQSISLGRPEDSPYKGTTPIEGVPILLRICLQDMRAPHKSRNDVFHSTCIFPVAFKVSGDPSEVLVTGSMNGWDTPIALEKVVNGTDVSFQTYLYLPPGEHEYRYLVDGVEKVPEDRKTISKYGKGACNYYPVSDVEVPEDQEDRDTILHVRWLRSNDFSGFDLLPDQNSLTYTPTEEDVGRCMRCEVLAYEDSNFSSLVFDITQSVQPGFPTCTALDILGDPMEGMPLSVEYTYKGGEEHSQLNMRWLRVSPEGNELDVTEFAEPDGLQYIPTADDVGQCIKVEYSPMRADWIAGNPVTATSRPVRPAGGK